MKQRVHSVLVLILTVIVLLLTSSRMPAQSGMCGGVNVMLPFNDVAGNPFFCQIAEAFFTGLTNGTTPTTYSPLQSVQRDQMAAFITRTQDSALRRGSRRAALGQWAIQESLTFINNNTFEGGNVSLVAPDPRQVKSDGQNLWIAAHDDHSVRCIRASDGQEVWGIGLNSAPSAILVARGVVWVTDDSNPATLYAVTTNHNALTLLQNLPASPLDMTTDGFYLWTANFGAGTNGSVSRVPFDHLAPAFLVNFLGGFTRPAGILFDGQSIWVSDYGDNTLKKLDISGNFLQVVPVGSGPTRGVFDGSNIWVPNNLASTVTVVRARDGVVLATLTGNGLNAPIQAAFDGERVLVTNYTGNSVSLWRAADFTPIGAFDMTVHGGPPNPSGPWGACSDGINFWITLRNNGSALARL